jgi:hypothetical protein
MNLHQMLLITIPSSQSAARLSSADAKNANESAINSPTVFLISKTFTKLKSQSDTTQKKTIAHGRHLIPDDIISITLGDIISEYLGDFIGTAPAIQSNTGDCPDCRLPHLVIFSLGVTPMMQQASIKYAPFRRSHCPIDNGRPRSSLRRQSGAQWTSRTATSP